MESKDILNRRVDIYEKVVNARIRKVRRNISAGRYADDEGHRVWLEQFTEGIGLDVCCGHIPMEGTEGVDSTFWHPTGGALGPLNHLRDGDDLGSFPKEDIDFVISNYLETFSSPLKVLHEWNRILKPGGKLAIVVANADKYRGPLGPLENRSRSTLFTPITIKFYLAKTSFEIISLEEINKAMRVLAEKV